MQTIRNTVRSYPAPSIYSCYNFLFKVITIFIFLLFDTRILQIRVHLRSKVLKSLKSYAMFVEHLTDFHNGSASDGNSRWTLLYYVVLVVYV